MAAKFVDLVPKVAPRWRHWCRESVWQSSSCPTINKPVYIYNGEQICHSTKYIKNNSRLADIKNTSIWWSDAIAHHLSRCTTRCIRKKIHMVHKKYNRNYKLLINIIIITLFLYYIVGFIGTQKRIYPFVFKRLIITQPLNNLLISGIVACNSGGAAAIVRLGYYCRQPREQRREWPRQLDEPADNWAKQTKLATV